MTERYVDPRKVGPPTKANKPSYFDAPILLAASTTLASAGATAIPQVAHLQHPFRTPILIDEVRFTIKSPTSTAVQPTGMGGVVYAKFALGRIELSEKFIPIWNYGTLFTTRLENESARIDPAPTRFNYAHYRWILPKPMFVPEGNQLVPTFLRDPQLLTAEGTITVNVAYAGRALQPGTRTPRTIEVPFIGYYEHPTTADYAQSNAKDLYNPFLVPLRIQRLIGRITGALSPGDDLSTTIGAGQGSTGLQIKIIDSDGYSVVDNSANNSTAFNAVFDAQRRAWTYNRALKRKQWLTVQTRFPGGNTSQARLQISSVGYREEKFR